MSYVEGGWVGRTKSGQSFKYRCTTCKGGPNGSRPGQAAGFTSWEEANDALAVHLKTRQHLDTADARRLAKAVSDALGLP